MLNFGVVIHLYNWLVLNLLLNPIAWKVVPLDQRWKTLTATLKIWVFFGGVMVCQPLKNMSDDNCKKCKPPLRKNNYHETYGKLAKKKWRRAPPPRKNRNGVVGTTGTKKPAPPGARMHGSKEASKVHLPGPTDPWVMEVMVAMMALIRTWRIIPFSKWLITMVSKSPNWGYCPYKWPKWLINRGY